MSSGNYLKRAYQFRVMQELQRVCKPIGEGFCSYIDGYSDEALAQHMTDLLGVKVTKVNVAGLRRELLGQMKVMPAPGSSDNLTTLTIRVHELEQRVAELEKYIQP